MGNKITKSVLIEKIRDIVGIMQRVKKEITTSDVPGLMLVREDLGVRRNKEKSQVHGQVHEEPVKKPKVTATDGQGNYPKSDVEP